MNAAERSAADANNGKRDGNDAVLISAYQLTSVYQLTSDMSSFHAQDATSLQSHPPRSVGVTLRDLQSHFLAFFAGGGPLLPAAILLS